MFGSVSYKAYSAAVPGIISSDCDLLNNGYAIMTHSFTVLPGFYQALFLYLEPCLFFSSAYGEHAL